MAFAAFLVAVLPHVGGVETPTTFVTPADVDNVTDQSFVVSWSDTNEDPTGLFDFYYQPSNNRPGDVDPAKFPGVPIPGAQGVAAMDAANQFIWDTGSVPSGSYYLYGVTTDPPLPQIFEFSKGTVTVQHPGDPLYPAVFVTQPDGFEDIVADEYPLGWRASGVGPMTATVRYADLMVSGDPLKVLIAGVAMTENPDGTFDGATLWDLRPHPAGSYFFVEVTVTDDAGRTHSAFSPSTLIIYRSDAGMPPDASASGDASLEPPPGPTCGCTAGGNPSGSAVLALLALVGAWRAKRSPPKGQKRQKRQRD